MSLKQGLTLAGRECDRNFQCYLQAASRSLRNGTDLASALTVHLSRNRKRERYFDPWAIALIRLAENQGTLPETCLLLAETWQTQAEWAKYHRSMRTSTFLALWSLLTLVVGIINPNPTALLEPQFWLQSAGIALLLWILLISIARYLPSFLAPIGMYLPFARQFIEAYALCNLAQVRLPLSCAMPILTALELVREQVPNITMRHHLSTATRQMRRGQTLSESFYKKVPAIALEFLRTGEETGDLAAAWENIARYYQGELNKGLSFLNTSLRLISFLALANLVLIVCIRAMMAILNATNP